MRGLLLVFYQFWACSLSAVQGAILYPPVSANVSARQSTVFTCTAVADFIEWTVDNKPYQDVNGFDADTEALNSTIGLRQSKLDVVGLEENDHVSIICLAFNESKSYGDWEVDKSDPVLLRVQGLLESVSNLTVTLIDSTTVLISWSPPFTLEGVPILGYEVTITNNASEKYETMFIENNTLYYYYDYHDWTEYYNSEDEYYITVAPNNRAGTGSNVTSDPFTFPPLPSSTTPTVGSSQTVSGDVTSHETSPSPSVTSVFPSVGVAKPVSSEMLLIGSIVPALIVTLLVFVLVVMVVVCVVVKRNRHKKNNTRSDCSRQGSEESFANEEVPQTVASEEPTQQQETEQPVPSNHEPNIITTPQREQNQAQLGNPTVPKRVERSSSLIDESRVLSTSPVNNQQRRGSLQRGKQIDLYDRPTRAGETSRRPSGIATLMQQRTKNLQGYQQIALQSSMSTEDEDESKQSSQRHDVAIQVDSLGNRSPTPSRASPINKRLQPLLLRPKTPDEQHGVKQLPTEASSPLEWILKRTLNVASFESRRGSSDSPIKEEHKILLEEQG